MAKNKKKVNTFEQEKKAGVVAQDQTSEHILIIPNECLSEELKAKEDDVKKEVTTAMDKVQDLLQVAVNEVIEGVMPLGEILTIAKRKVRMTSVLSEEEDNELDKLHIEVDVKY